MPADPSMKILVVDDAIQCGSDGLGGDVRIGPRFPNIRHDRFNDVDGLENDTDDRRANRHISLSELVENVFSPMRDVHQVIKP